MQPRLGACAKENQEMRGCDSGKGALEVTLKQLQHGSVWEYSHTLVNWPALSIQYRVLEYFKRREGRRNVGQIVHH